MDFINKMIEDLQAIQDKPSTKKKKKGKILVKFADTVGNGLIKPENFTEDTIKAHREAVMEADPLVKSVFEAMGRPAPIAVKASKLTGSSQERLSKSVMNLLDGSEDSIERLAFETNPTVNNTYQGLFRRKLRGLPDEVLKRIAIQDDLVAAIVNTRSQMLSAFGRPQPDRFSTGYRIEAEPGLVEKLDSDGKKELQDQIERAEALLLTCGQTKGWADHSALSFSAFLFMQARNAVIFGRCATEVIYITGPDGQKRPHSFRPIDAGTIYRAAPLKEAAQQVRDQALKILSQIKNKNLKPERYVNDDYTYVQVIEGRPMQAFTDDECLVHNFYPITDIEWDGYPLTPMDTVISAVTTHINITTHNKLYFQSGRAARGMLVFKSDDVDERVVDPIRQQFHANINGVGNAWRMPIFGIGSDDDVSWQPIDNSSRDMEFQYLSDTNARVILSAFQMSPEELPGYAHLSRGTNNQALSESNNEYKLEAHRDVGIRPLLAQMQNYVNQRIFPLLDEELSKKASIKFVGLDVDTAEKESARLQQDMAVHMTMDEVLDKVEKKPVGKAWGGQFLLNPQWQQALFSHRYVGEIMEEFFGVKGASQDPTLRYIRDPMWFSWQQLLMEQQQAQMAAQQPQQPQEGGGGEGQEGGGESGPGDGQNSEQEDQGELASGADQLGQLMSKSEKQLPASKRRLLYHERKLVEEALKGFENDSQQVIKQILSDTHSLLPNKLKKK